MRRKHARRISGASNLREDPINPLDGVANLADIMLVLAVGIMLALVINWNIDLSGQISRMESVGSSGDTEVDPSSVVEMDMQVYMDEETGNYYVVQPE